MSRELLKARLECEFATLEDIDRARKDRGDEEIGAVIEESIVSRNLADLEMQAEADLIARAIVEIAVDESIASDFFDDDELLDLLRRKKDEDGPWL
jgi:hypothetical protein